jgi:hypothetical protein
MRNLSILLLMIIALCPMLARAQYVLQTSVISAGGAHMSGSTYAVTGTVGQSSPVGISSGSTYMTHHGFWHTVGGGAALDAMLLAIELISPTTARLSWTAVVGATFYDLYRSSGPYFSASGSPWQTVAAPTTQHDFTDGIGDSNTNYFFKGIAKNVSQTSPESNTVGEFDVSTNDSPSVSLRVRDPQER